MEDNLKKLKMLHEDLMNRYAEQVRSNCYFGDDLSLKKEMVAYHRGAYNALIELEKSEK